MKNVVIPQISGHIQNPFSLCSQSNNFVEVSVYFDSFNPLALYVASTRPCTLWGLRLTPPTSCLRHFLHLRIPVYVNTIAIVNVWNYEIH